MQDLTAQLRDIQGLDAISWWPPAPGWWIALSAVVALIGLALWWWRRRHAPRPARWQTEALHLVEQFERRLDHIESHEMLATCSELTRRIAMARHGRNSCAALSGQKWLEWLTANDPQEFDWTEYRHELLSGVYGPPQQFCDSDYRIRVNEILSALKAWVSDV